MRGIHFMSLSLLLAALACAGEADWPTYGNGVERQHRTKHQLADKLLPEWEMRFPRPRHVFWSEPQLFIDRAYEPVLAGDTVYVGSQQHRRGRGPGPGNGREEVVLLRLRPGAPAAGGLRGQALLRLR
jgi:hypothetical protein